MTSPTTTTSAPKKPQRLPARFHAWWAASTAAAAGDSLLAFAIIWAATGHGPGAITLVSTAAVLPRIVLFLVGGALGDRHGTRGTLIVTVAFQLKILGILAALLGAFGLAPSTGFLVAASAALAVVSGIQQPAAVVHSRQLIDDDGQLPRVLARISGGATAARILGVACGGAVIGRWSLETAIVIDAAVVAVSLVVLLVQSSRTVAVTPQDGPTRRGLLCSVAEGLRSARTLRIGPLLLAVALVTGSVLPVVTIALPMTARGWGWTSTQASLLESGWATGMLAVTLAVSFTGTLTRQRIALAGGPALVAAALLVLATTPDLPAAIAASALIGAGTAGFTTHIAPMLLRLAPSGQMARFQSLMSLVQLVPPAVLNGPVATLADLGTGSAAFVLAAVLASGASVLSLRQRQRQRQPPATAPWTLDNS